MTLGLERLLGQPDVARRLGAMLERGRLAHALLFAGPGGAGKLAAARVLTQILQCEAGSKVTACDQCPGCHKVKEGLHADVHLVATEARNLKVGEIREATRALQLRPMEGRYKVLIIDQADRMTEEAQNALLKTLEEPPGTSLLVLTSARPRAILPTVLSRCQRLSFLPIPREAIARALVAERNLSQETAELVAAMAQGSLTAARALDPEALVVERDRVASLDLELEPGKRGSLARALDLAGQIAGERPELAALLDMLLVWLHDQVVLASGAAAEIANVDRQADLLRLVEARGLRTVLERTAFALDAKRRLDAPTNLNTQMIAERLCLGLAGALPTPAVEPLT